MKKVMIYDLNKYAKEVYPGKKLLGYPKGICILEGENGYFAMDEEAVGFEIATKKGTIEIELTEPDKGDGVIHIMPKWRDDISINEIMTKCESREEELLTFFDRYNYNNRLARNYQGLKEIMKEIGLNITDYVDK